MLLFNCMCKCMHVLGAEKVETRPSHFLTSVFRGPLFPRGVQPHPPANVYHVCNCLQNVRFAA